MSRPAAKAGFALPSVLFVVAMVTLVYLVAIEALVSLATETRRAKQGAAFEAEALSVEAQTALLAATRPLGPASILDANRPAAPALLALDGTAYQAAPGVTVSAQDEAGLVNLDNLPQPAVARLFAALHVAPGYQPAMIDRFDDFIDPTDLKRPQGADASDYLQAGMPPPPKGPLVQRDQVLGVMSWRQTVSDLAWRAAADDITADPISVASNVNTATPLTLQVMYGLTPAQAAAAVAMRAQAPFSELEDLGRASGLALHGDAERVYTMPNGRFALKVEDADAGLVYRARLLLSPDDTARPFWVVEARAAQLTAAEKASLPTHAPNLPSPAD
jgi:general secretion pathway protein K